MEVRKKREIERGEEEKERVKDVVERIKKLK
jgi:hypothetical protein